MMIVALGVSDWRARGRPWLATLSWALPMAGLWIVAQVIVDSPKTRVVLVYWLASAPVAFMVFSTRAERWWFEAVLRQPYPP